MTDLLTFIEATKGTSLKMNKKHKIFDVGKENRKTLVERTLRGFYVPGAEAQLLWYVEVQIWLTA